MGGWLKEMRGKLRIIATCPWEGFLTGDLFDQVPADQAGRNLSLFNQTIAIKVFGGEDSFHCTRQADMPGDCPGIHAFHTHDAVSD